VAQPVTAEERARLRQLHAKGLGRNAIAAELGRSAGTVTKLAAEMGLSFDRTHTVEATAAKKADAAALRAQLTLDYLSDAQRLRQQMWQQHKYWDWGGKDHLYDEVTVDEPTPADKLKLMQASATAADRSMKLELHDADKSADDAKSMLGSLAAGLQAAYEQMCEEG
jgi:hypothetical protein